MERLLKAGVRASQRRARRAGKREIVEVLFVSAGALVTQTALTRDQIADWEKEHRR